MEDQGSTQFNLSMSQLHTFLNSHGLLEQCKPALDQLLITFRRQRTELDQASAQLQQLRAEKANPAEGVYRSLGGAPIREAASAGALALVPQAPVRSLDDRPGKRARLSLEGEKFRERIVDEVPPTGLALAQLGRDAFPTEIIQDGDQLQEVVARDGPVRRLRIGLFRDGVAIKGEEVAPEGIRLKVQLRHEGRVIDPRFWLNATGSDNPSGKNVFAEGHLQPGEHEVIIPISVKALSSNRDLFPGTSRNSNKHALLMLAVVVDVDHHGGSTLGVDEARTRPFVSKAKADSARCKIPGAIPAAKHAGAHKTFASTSTLDELGAGGGGALTQATRSPSCGLDFLMEASAAAARYTPSGNLNPAATLPPELPQQVADFAAPAHAGLLPPGAGLPGAPLAIVNQGACLGQGALTAAAPVRGLTAEIAGLTAAAPVRGHTAEINGMLNQDAIAMLAETFPGGSGGVQGSLQMMPGLHVLDDANTPPTANLGSH